MIMEQTLIIIGAAIIGLLGSAHLVYTFFTNKLCAYDNSVNQAMQNSTLVLTRQTSMWKAWVGFNASHSLGAILFAAVYIPMSYFHFDVIEHSLWFALLPVITGLSYLFLASRYWFNLPFWGIFFATLCFAMSILKLTVVN